MRQGPPRRAPALVAVLLLSGALAACASQAAARVALPTPTASAIQLTLDRTAYTTSQPIGVTVTNTSKQDYYAVDGLSACTFLQLQFYDPVKKTWVGTDGCSSPNPPTPRLISAHLAEPLTLPPGNAPDNGNVWATGMYRVAVRYGTHTDGSGDVEIAYSPGFQIAGG
jgi:hypothetical protein